jgi:hypothetical protein
VRRSALIGFVALAVASCAQTAQEGAVDFSPTTRHLRADDYDEVLQRWSRHQKVVSEVGTVLEVWAVLQGPEFREAYVERYADVYRLGEAERDALHDTQVKRSNQYYEFHVTAQSTEFRWNDLDSRESAWRVTLVDAAGNAIAPASIESPRMPEPYQKVFFPARTPFTRSYVIRFDREVDDRPFAGAASGRLTLRFASPLGEATLVWRAR